MSDAWRAELDRVLLLTDKDEAALGRLGARLGENEREILRAAIETRGDVRAIAERLGPLAVAKLRGRMRLPDRARQPVAAAWRTLEAPLSVMWNPPSDASAEEIASAFLERYGARMNELTGGVSKAAAAARALGETLRSASSAKELIETTTTLRTAAEELRSAATSCSHPETEGAAWPSHAQELAREALDAVESVRSLQTQAKEAAERFKALARALTEWVDAPPATRASQAEGMAARVRAAADAAAGMHTELLRAVMR
jgi:hypothetical protein